MSLDREMLFNLYLPESILGISISTYFVETGYQETTKFGEWYLNALQILFAPRCLALACARPVSVRDSHKTDWER
jgi:hypothetical protein